MDPYEEKEQSKENLKRFTFFEIKNGIRLGDDVRNLDYENTTKSLEGMIEVFKEFPKAHLKKFITYFEARDTTDGIMLTEGGVVIFNKNFYSISTAKNLQREITFELRKKLCIANYCEKSIGHHEAGHLLEYALCHLRNNNHPGLAIRDYNLGLTRKEIFKNAMNSMKKGSYNKRELDKLAMDLSGSATDNRSDFFAECVADFMTNKENAKAISKAVHKEVMRMLDDFS